MSDKQTGQDDSVAALERRARADLRRLVTATDPAIRARLDQAAARAASLAPRRWRSSWWIGLPIGTGVAAALVVALALRPPGLPPQPRATAADDLAMLLNVDSLDLLEQMEFYQWLDGEPASFGGEAIPGAQRS